MKNGRFDVGTIIKGKDLKKELLCKVISEDMIMKDFQYKMGMNEDINPLVKTGSCEAGLHFCLIKDACNYLKYGASLAVIKIPDDEDVYVDDSKFRAHRMVIERIMPLYEVSTWKYLYRNGADISACNNYAVRNAAENDHLKVLKYLYKKGADITVYDNYAIRCASENGYFEIVKYLHKKGADITAYDNCAVRAAAKRGHLEIVKYLYKNGANITEEDKYKIRKLQLLHSAF